MVARKGEKGVGEEDLWLRTLWLLTLQSFSALCVGRMFEASVQGDGRLHSCTRTIFGGFLKGKSSNPGIVFEKSVKQESADI